MKIDLIINEKACLFKNLIIPKGYRIIEDWEVLKEIRTNKVLKKIIINDYIFTNTVVGIRLVGISDVINFNKCARGVFVKLKECN